MKYCPFLVAGQSMATPQQRTAPTSAFETPDVDAILQDSSVASDLFGSVSDYGDVDRAADDASAPHREGGESDSDAAKTASGDLGIVRFKAPSFSTSLPVPVSGTGKGVGVGSLECLGEVCRFFHAGGCRFDVLFDATLTRGAAPVVVGTIVDGVQNPAGGLADGSVSAAGASSILDEVWSLQRESLREVMSGFQKLETDVEAKASRVENGVGKVASQVSGVADQVGSVTTQVGKVHSQVSDAVSHVVQVAANVGQMGASFGKVESRVGEIGGSIGQVGGQVTQVVSQVNQIGTQVTQVGTQVTQVGTQVAQVGTSMGRVESQVTKVESQVTLVAAAVATVESQLKRFESAVSSVQTSVAVVSSEIHDLRTQIVTIESQVKSGGETRRGLDPELLDLVGRHFESLGRDMRQLEVALRGTLTESVRAAVKESQVTAQQTVAASEVGLRAALEHNQGALRSVVQETLAALRGTVGESQTQLGSLLSRATAETRAAVERGLGKMLEEMGAVRDTRTQIQSALDGLARETHEVAVLARRLESSQVLTHELLDEQRQVTAKLDEREKRERARQLNNAGVLSYHQGSYDSSVGHFQQATELDPSLAEAFNNLGLSYTEMGRDEEATIAFQRALELDPQAAHVYNNLGYLYYRRGDLSHAVEMYQRAIQRGADSSAAYSNLGNAYYRLKRVDQAVEAWRRALEIDPANQKPAMALERLGLETRPS